MGKDTAIEWTDHTFNPWWGCERVSPACAHCYADDLAKRWGYDVWDSGGFRFLSEGNWSKPVSWNHDAKEVGTPRFVFCASMADVFQQHPDLVAPRERLWGLIDRTPWLTWLLLTKRPENIQAMLPWDEAPANVWLGTSVENARHTFRVAHLVEVRAPVHFLSCEPLLGSLFTDRKIEAHAARWYGDPEVIGPRALDLHDVEWVIAGGESGPHYREMNLEHVRELRDACAAEAVPFFLKQIGGRFPKQHGKAIDGREWCQRPQPAAPDRAVALF